MGIKRISHICCFCFGIIEIDLSCFRLKDKNGNEAFAYVVVGNITQAAAKKLVKPKFDSGSEVTIVNNSYYDLSGAVGNKITVKDGELTNPESGSLNVNGSADNKVDIADVRAVFDCQSRNKLYYSIDAYTPTYLRADVNMDHTVDATDLVIVVVKNKAI